MVLHKNIMFNIVQIIEILLYISLITNKLEIDINKIPIESPNIWNLNNTFYITHMPKKKSQVKLENISN